MASSTGERYIYYRKPGKRDGANCAPFMVSINYGAHRDLSRPSFYRRASTMQEAIAQRDAFLASQKVIPAALKRANHPKAKRTKPMTAAEKVAWDIINDARAKATEKGFVYLVIEEGNPSVAKIGWTSKTPPEARLNDYQAGNPRKLVMLGTLPGTKRRERALHRKYVSGNILGEWFAVTAELLHEFNLNPAGIGGKPTEATT
jgi:hypothetical protein